MEEKLIQNKKKTMKIGVKWANKLNIQKEQYIMKEV